MANNNRRVFIPVPFLLLVAIAFIGFGDSFLPKPLNKWSRDSRESINQFISGLAPSWQPKKDPYKRTEDALEQEQQ